MKTENKKLFKQIDFVELKQKFREGINVTQFLAQKLSLSKIDAEVIRYAYDLQAGSYTDYYTKHSTLWNDLGHERAEIIQKYGKTPNSLLDGGTGEATTLTSILNHMKTRPKEIHAFDISLSRLLYAQEFLKRGQFERENVKLAMADLREIPYVDQSFDLVLTTEAIEPNGGYVTEIISELFRVARQTVIMIEPYYEGSSAEAKARMDSHNYVRDLPAVIEKLGGALVSLEPLKVNVNPLNPYWAFVVTPPRSQVNQTSAQYQCPVSHTPLTKIGDVLFSEQSGLAYPIIQGIPLLDSSNFFVAHALSR